ncbi:MAG: 16S rRNA (guanine966-N2)-methyltransferase [Cognaticolwellia sp.]|jgi:16S rRNA (guanine(966)-N(2))-methyltransferase RsmD
MRIIAGDFKGRKFYPPADKWPTRPTTDFAKEGLFNVINNNFYFNDLKVLDLFGGTGNHSYEFISRGCEDVTYVDKFSGCLKFVRETAKTLDIEDKINIIRADVFKFIESAHSQWSYIFAGPPYGLASLDAIPDLIFEKKMLKAEGWFVLEHNPNHNFKNHPNLHEVRNYGKTIFSIFTNEAANETKEL